MEDKLYVKDNVDDVFNRVIIVGLLDLLNHKIVYDQVWDDNVIENVTVPWAYEFGSSDERFMQDNYTFFGKECFGDRKIDGKFDMMPRGFLKYTGSTINASEIVNRFIQGRFMRREGGRIVSYVAQMYSIPLTFNFECTMYADNLITAFKIESAIREAFYKNKTFSALYRGMRLMCTAGFPENTGIEKTTEYSFDSQRDIKMTFSIVVEAYQPVFDNTTEIEASNVIEHIGYDIEHFTGGVTPADRDVHLTFRDMDIPEIIPSGTSFYIAWDSKSNVSDVCSVTISYIDEDGNEVPIKTLLDNVGYYMWDIPKDFSGYTAPEISYFPLEGVTIEKEPEFRIIPVNSKIAESSFKLVDPGSVSGLENGAIPMQLSYITDVGTTRLSDHYHLNISNGHVCLDHPVICRGAKMTYKSDMKLRRISLKITYPLDTSVYDKIDNILIL